MARVFSVLGSPFLPTPSRYCCYWTKGEHFPAKPNKPGTGACSEESKGLFQEVARTWRQVSWRSKTWLPSGFQGTGHTGEKSLITVTKGVRVEVRPVFSTDRAALQAVCLVLTSALAPLCLVLLTFWAWS